MTRCNHINKIIDYSNKVISYCANINDINEFMDNSLVVEACALNLIQIGELVNKIDKSFINDNPHIPWRAVYNLRNRIVHDYEGLIYMLIWKIIKQNLPDFVILLNEIKEAKP